MGTVRPNARKRKIHTAVNIKKFLKYPLNDLKTFLIIFAYVQEFIKKKTQRGLNYF